MTERSTIIREKVEQGRKDTIFMQVRQQPTKCAHVNVILIPVISYLYFFFFILDKASYLHMLRKTHVENDVKVALLILPVLTYTGKFKG